MHQVVWPNRDPAFARSARESKHRALADAGVTGDKKHWHLTSRYAFDDCRAALCHRASIARSPAAEHVVDARRGSALAALARRSRNRVTSAVVASYTFVTHRDLSTQTRSGNLSSKGPPAGRHAPDARSGFLF